MGAERVQLPPGGAAAIRRAHDERMRLERLALRAWRKRVEEAVRHARDRVLGTQPDRPWTVREHAGAMRELRGIARNLGADLSAAALDVGTKAASEGASRTPIMLAALAALALRRRVAPPPIDLHRAETEAHTTIVARTDDVGARAGEDVGAALVGESWRAARAPEPQTAARVAGAVGAMLLRRGTSAGDRVLVTEATAGYGIGGAAARAQMQERMPRLRKALDATLDMKVCPICAGLHHVVVDDDKPFPGGYDDVPIHANCRCAVIPWLDDFNDILDALDVSPGLRAGVAGSMETQLMSFGASALTK